MISEYDLEVMKILARAGAYDLAFPMVRQHLLSDIDAEVSDETISDLVARAGERIIDAAPMSFSFQKACGLFMLRMMLDGFMTGETPMPAQAFSVQIEINRMLENV